MQRLEVREMVLTCQACELCSQGNGPVPFSGPAPNFLAVLGEAPGRFEDEKGMPFVGPAGELLRGALVAAEIDPAHVFFANAVSCWPGRTPNAAELVACRANMLAQLELCNPVWLCVLGGVALSTLRPDLKISRTRGKVLRPPDHRWKAFVTFHPSYALRNAKGEAILHRDLALLTQMMDSDNYQLLTDDACVTCGVSPEQLGEHDEHLRFDEWDVPYCSTCWLTTPPAKAEKKRERVQEKSGQLFPA